MPRDIQPVISPFKNQRYFHPSESTSPTKGFSVLLVLNQVGDCLRGFLSFAQTPPNKVLRACLVSCMVTEGGLRAEVSSLQCQVPWTSQGWSRTQCLLVRGHQGFSGYLGIPCFAGPFSCPQSASREIAKVKDTADKVANSPDIAQTLPVTFALLATL